MKAFQASLLVYISHTWAAPAPQASSCGNSGSLRPCPGLVGYDPSNHIPTSPSTEVPTDQFELAPGQSEDADLGLFIDLSKVKNPQPIRGGTTGPTDSGPRTEAYDRLNSDVYAPPSTDSGDIPNAKWPFALSHNRHGLAGAGWARNQNTDQLPIATSMAGVDMRLSANAYRELHWHKSAEWALMLSGSARVGAVNENGENFLDDVTEGDVWFFPSGVPHSIQALENGCEFLLVFSDGKFSEENTFLLTELIDRTPKSVVAKNFRTSLDTFKAAPDKQLWIFPGTQAPTDIEKQNQTGPAGIIPKEFTYSFHWSEQQPYRVPGGSIKILDPETFPIASEFSVALVTVEPGAMREMHWHTTSDEWTYFIKGQARLTVYQAPSSSRTFDFSAGDVGYVPVPNAHYLENTGNETLMFLEVLRAPRYADISVNQWLGITPKQVVQDHLKVGDAFLNTLPKVKPYIVPGNTNLLTTNFTGNTL
ncbi:hypothetical protein PMIN06_011782 [Paraphaeosphaeria minitans]|uniref:Oxalate decarboxylase n=1 Tax=Paraphaeosphaeria minitans TaxID=565426 RepID=R9QAK1_9PLEO|nr:oxalate decarboxylase [Paraphaeosphaeria minitans]KAF9741927.1 Oxalate decarboxylase OxdD [Paraphaeosphaeria minitans]